MNACHTREQRQAVGIEEDLTVEPTREAKSKRRDHQQQNPNQQQQKKRQRSGTIKTYACRQCGFNSKTKEEQWVHAKGHIPNEKQLKCTKCQFLTEHKHHLMYHTRSHHTNVKPFNCTKCKYTCVTNSMLNSHMK